MTVGTDTIAPELVTQALGRLLEVGPHDLEYWQWLTLPLLLLAGAAFGQLLSRATQFVLGRLAARTQAPWDDQLVRRMGAPITGAWTLVVVRALLPTLGLTADALGSVQSVLRGSWFVLVFWAAARSINVAALIIGQSSWAQSSPASRTLLPLGARMLQVFLLAIAVVALLSDLGYPVASLLAGFGIGGVAMALAAQKTVENLFGAFSIGADQPFREGDFVKVEDFVGTVEKVGLRSTRIRTLDRTLITIPNGKLAELRIESYSARDRFRLSTTVGITYDARAADMQRVLEGLEKALREHPKTWQEAVVVRFKEFGASSLDIEVMAWFEVADWAEFQGVRQEILLKFMAVVERAGCSFAFPTRTVHVVTASPHRSG
jgi:MscS family membrane protein